jgi:hypothetical protein
MAVKKPKNAVFHAVLAKNAHLKPIFLQVWPQSAPLLPFAKAGRKQPTKL